MTAAHDHDYDDVHHLVERLTPDQLVEVRAHALRLVSGRQTFVPWGEVRRTAARLPRIDYAEFRSDVDAVIDQDTLLGDGQ
ncbi:hypothetical protein AAH991_15400 [Microbispora sp. ZYX-F-249]|uniref:Uncharacterized protein n=1 Tax=Microbispora maris TaxID=3144104 RepID=A0ABV0AMH1_9ACTN